MDKPMPGPRISAIAALDQKTRDICHGGDLLWKFEKDLQRVKKYTLNHPIIMGRVTYESIGRPLPKRTNIVVTRNTSYSPEGVIVAHSIEEALEKAAEKDREEIFIFGGAEIYTLALPKTDRLYLTLVENNKKEGTSRFPEYEDVFTKEIPTEDSGSMTEVSSLDNEEYTYTFKVLERE